MREGGKTVKLTKKHYFLKPDQSDKYNIDNQNFNWDRIDRILTGMKMRMAIQTIIQLLLVRAFMAEILDYFIKKSNPRR